MTDQSALLAAILSNPDEDTPRLEYADWLQENGDDDRAEFIRVQCELAFRRATLTSLKPRKEADENAWQIRSLDLRSMELLKKRYQLGQSRNAERWVTGGKLPVLSIHSEKWSRGFATDLTCSSEVFFELADSIIWRPGEERPCPPTVQTLKKVTLTTGTAPMNVSTHWDRIEFQFQLPGRRWRRITREEIVTGNLTRKQICELTFQKEWPGIKFDCGFDPAPWLFAFSSASPASA